MKIVLAGAFGNLGFEILKAVGHRIKVRHGAYAGVSARGRRHRTGLYTLLIKKTRLSEMDMHITETGQFYIFAFRLFYFRHMIPFLKL